MSTIPRFIGLDIHRQFAMITAVNAQQKVLFDGVRVALDIFEAWAQTQLRTTHHVALESTTNAWAVYDVVDPVGAKKSICTTFSLHFQTDV